MVAPMADPALKIPIPNALSFIRNHSETTFTPAGKLADSKTPKKNLNNEK